MHRPLAGLVAFIIVVMTILSVTTIVGNSMVLLSFYLDKNIRQPSNYYIFSLALSDLIIGLEGFPVRHARPRAHTSAPQVFSFSSHSFRCSPTSL